MIYLVYYLTDAISEAIITKRMTQAAFEERCNTIHAGKYDYSKAIYTGNNVKVEIGCPLHGTFYQIPYVHYYCGCPECGKIVARDKVSKRNIDNTKTTAQFINEAILVHGDRYDYSNTEYVGALKHLSILCKTHGEFKQTPAVHIGLHKSGCPTCASETNALKARTVPEDFIARCVKIHGNKYGYDDTKYIDSYHKIEVNCWKHGKFICRPSAHLQGSGCPSCGKYGYRIKDRGSIYVLSSGDKVKVGITNRSVATRCRELSKNAKSKFSVFKSWEFEDGSVPMAIETEILRILKQTYSCLTGFNGSSEVFVGVDPNYIITLIEQELS